jgi:hypothetical protein
MEKNMGENMDIKLINTQDAENYKEMLKILVQDDYFLESCGRSSGEWWAILMKNPEEEYDEDDGDILINNDDDPNEVCKNKEESS